MKKTEKNLTKQEAFKMLLLKLPKTEIHLHIEGTATVKTIWNLMKKNNSNIEGVKEKSDLIKKFQITNLEEFLDVYINVVQSSLSSEEDLEYLVFDTGEYLKSNNIRYAEIFFAPSKFIQMGFDFKKMITILDSGASKIFEKYGIELKFLVDVSRSFGLENAMSNLDLVLKNPVKSVIGIGLGGSEINGPAKNFTTVFEKATSKGLHIVAHAGEDVGPESVWDTVKLLKAERIGHGISSILDTKLIDYLKEKQIPLEICPTSNLFTGKYAKTLEEHPVKEFFNRGVYTTINTDDPTLFSVSLIDEYMMLLEKNIFSEKEIIFLIKNNIYATFLPKTKKDKLWKECQTIIKKSAPEFL